MTPSVTLEQVSALAAQLSPTERLRLVERLVHDLASSSAEAASVQRWDWLSVRGIAPNLLEGEDAQAWVSRTRQEGDEQREKQWRRQT